MQKYFFHYLLFFSLIFSLKIFSQNDTLISKHIIISDSLIIVDNHFINQNEFNIYKNNVKLPDSLYHINFSTGLIIFNKKLHQDTVTVYYKLLNPNIIFSKRDTSVYIPVIEQEPFFLQKNNDKQTNNQKLYTNGSLQRSFSNGNNQSFSINTDVDLQISGKVSDNLFLDCNISDSSIPLDYGQSTTSLQEVDKIFMKLYNQKMSLKGGDIIMKSLLDPFLTFSRNAIGLNYNRIDSINKNTASIGITKNIFRRQSINPINGNQGPYKLTGNNNEFYILIIPNSEKVFIDGVKKESGLTKDYTINYNTGEIIFTTNTLINENQRMIIEFQYSGQNYFRWLSYFGTNFQKGDFVFKLNFFSEQDSKSNPIVSFSENELNTIMSNGDGNIFSDFFPPVEHSQTNSQILYEIKDTIDFNFIEHDSIYVFSNNPNTNLYNINFIYVGDGQGNYVLEQNLLNGNVFIWTSPINGLKQGDYEPKKILIAPQKKQMITLGFDYEKKQNLVSVNLALSNYDKNLFSNIDDENNISWAMNVLAQNNKSFEKMKLQSTIKYEFLEKHFSFIERTRDLEFSRNWNLIDSVINQQRQHKIKINLVSDFLKNGKTTYSLEFMNINKLKKLRHIINADIKKNHFQTKLTASLLNDYSVNQDFVFLQYNFLIEKIGRLKVGINNLGEKKDDKLNQLNNTRFNKLILFSSISNHKKKVLDINYSSRFDVKPQNLGETYANSLELITDVINKKNAKLHIQSSYSIYNSNIEDSIKMEENIMGRLSYALNISNHVRLNGYYEISNGKEFIRDFRYIKVNPGYGSFSWIDYNNNGLEEFDEFENSNFADTADYIRISFPTNESFNVRNLKYNQQINIHPTFSNAHKFSSFFSRIQNSINIQINKKFLADDWITIINPFFINLSSNNTLNVNLNMMNNLTYKSNNNKYIISYKIQRSLVKNTLNYGEESSSIKSHNIQAQRHFKLFVLNINYLYDYHDMSNQNMLNRNYMIEKNQVNTELSFNFKKITPSFVLSYIKKGNSNDERLNGLKLNFGLSLSSSKNLTLRSNIMAFTMNYNGDDLSPIGHDMLEGLSSGQGLEIQLLLSKSINQTSFSIQYTSRLNQKNIIHGARFELKKYF